MTSSQRRQLHDNRTHTSHHLPQDHQSQRGPVAEGHQSQTSSSSPVTEEDQSTLTTQSAVARAPTNSTTTATTNTNNNPRTSPHPDSDEIVIDVATAGSSSPPQLVGFSDSVRSPSYTAQQTNHTNNNSMSTTETLGGVGGPGSNNGTNGIDERPLLGNAAAGSTSEAHHSPLVYGSLDTTAATTPDTAGGSYHRTSSGDRAPPPLTSMTNDYNDIDDGSDSGSPRSARYPHTVAIVNPLSGERSAAEFVYQSLCDDLGPNRVLKLSKEIFQDPRSIRLLIQRAVRRDGIRGTVVVSGGDGTVAFIMSQIDVLAEANGVDGIVVVDGVGALTPLADDDGSSPPPPMMPAVAVLALGTGNDFSNCMGFGNGYTKHKVCCMCVCCVNHVNSLLDAVTSAPASPFDRWVASITPFSDSNPSAPVAPAPPAPFVKPPREVIFMNYFSFGMDAFIATHFDKLRKKFPSCFQYRFQNKGWYGGLGIYGWAKSDRLNPLVSKMQLLVNPANIKAANAATIATSTTTSPPTASSSSNPTNMISSVLPPKTKALVISNVNSYSGGTVLWHPGANNGAKYCVSKTPSRVYVNDKQLEIQALGGLVDMTMLQMKIGNGADKIAQAKEIVISIGSPSAAVGLKKPVPLQADGEPIGCLTEAAEVHIRLYPRQIYVRCANTDVVRRADPMNIVQLL